MNASESLQKTPLYDLHIALGARMVDYAGYTMPVQYPSGVLQEHLHTRESASLFDVSHMGQIRICGKDAAETLESLIPTDIIGLSPGQQRYGFLCLNDGGILDDLMLYRTPQAVDEFVMVVNGARKHEDLAHLKSHLQARFSVDGQPHSSKAQAGLDVKLETQFDRALLALQGPKAVTALGRLNPQSMALAFMQAGRIEIEGIECLITRSGYSGEDGFEISVAAHEAQALARLLLEQPEVKPAGLGARNSLRLEAGLCLYGADLNTQTTPVEAGLNWAIPKIRRYQGARAGGFLGAEVILAQLDGKRPLQQRRISLLGLERTPVREPASIEDAQGQVLGHICSGLLSPCLDVPIAMAYVRGQSLFQPKDTVLARVRNKLIPMQVQAGPFVPHRYVRTPS